MASSNKHDALDSEQRGDSSERVRHPIEQLATQLTESLRSGTKQTIKASRTGQTETSIDDACREHDCVFDQGAFNEYQDQIERLSPIIEQLEQARRSRAAEASSWASLGRDRPDQLGDFRLKYPIGRGGMGVVFEAEQVSLGRTVALKILPKNVFEDQSQRTRFLREAKLIAQLHHTNIVPIYGIGFDDGCHYFVMQRLDGCSVDQLISSEGPMGAHRVARLAYQASLAIAHAHRHGVLHRDIKPSNLIVSDQDELWVTDFGVAKQIDAGDVTRDGDAVGTLRYMASEQSLGKADARSDVYSLGVTMYEMLSGKPALDDDQIARILARDKITDPVPIHSLCPGVPRDLAAVIEKSMASGATDRYQNADSLAEDLNRFLSGRPVSVRPLRALAKVTRWVRRYPATAALCTALLLSLSALATTMTLSAYRLSRSVAQQRQARTDAEQTASIATGALHGIFKRFNPDDTLSSNHTTVSLDPASAVVLEELLPYYDAIADQINVNDSVNATMLDIASHESRLSVAEIQIQLGQYDQAVSTLDEARAELDRLPLSDLERCLEQVHLDNKAGIALRISGDAEQAVLRHRAANERLTSISWPQEFVPTVNYQIARTHYLLAWFVLPGMGPDSFPPHECFGGTPMLQPNRQPQQLDHAERHEHLDTCIKLVTRILDEHASDSAVDKSRTPLIKASERLLANAYLARGRRVPSPMSRSNSSAFPEDVTKSIHLLRKLIKESPSNDNLRFQLATTLADLNIFNIHLFAHNDFAWLQWEQHVADLREAKAILEKLSERHPNVPRYVLGSIHTKFKLARLIERPHAYRPAIDKPWLDKPFFDRTGIPHPRRETLVEASELYRASAKELIRLIQLSPDSDAYRVWHLVITEHVADVLAQLHWNKAAIKAYTRVNQAYEQLANRHHYDADLFDQSHLASKQRLDRLVERMNERNGGNSNGI